MSSSDTPVDIKPRSRDVTDGIQKAASRADAPCRRVDRRRLGQAADRHRLVVERDHAVQRVDPSPHRGGEGGRACRRWCGARVRHDHGVRRHLDGPRGHARLAGVARDHRRLGRVRDARRAARRSGRDGRLRQVDARHDDGDRPAEPAWRVRLQRLDPARLPQRQGARHHVGVRGDRRLRGRQRSPRTSSRDREERLPGRGRLRWHVHRQHDELDR